METIAEVMATLQNRIGQITVSSRPMTLYRCNVCHDNGWIETRDENGCRIARKCECMKARQAEELMRASGLSEMLDSKTFDSFLTGSAMQERLKRTAIDYTKAVIESNGQPNRPWLYIGGNPGCGKTHICTAICGELLKNNVGVKYMQWLDESRNLKASVNDPDFDDEVYQYTAPTVLYIDDFLKQKYTENPVFTDADIKIAFTILNERYFQNKPTIISSEWDLTGQLFGTDEGTFSRVYERCKHGFLLTIPRSPEYNYRLRECG